jgi:hypothetical protein
MCSCWQFIEGPTSESIFIVQCDSSVTTYDQLPVPMLTSFNDDMTPTEKANSFMRDQATNSIIAFRFLVKRVLL